MFCWLSCVILAIAIMAIMMFQFCKENEPNELNPFAIYADEPDLDDCTDNNEAPLEGSNCDPSPTNKKSFCEIHPVVKAQIAKLIHCCHPENSCCLPNIGSSYLGSTVASTRDTKLYKHPQGTSKTEASNTPMNVLRPTRIIVGEGWSFVGVGFLVVKLFHPALITGFSVLHAPKCEIPDGYHVSAPKEIRVRGLMGNDIKGKNPFEFANYTYEITGNTLQSFPIQRCSEEKYQLIEFQFLSNHGNPDYTTVYKIRIHGDIGSPTFKNVANPPAETQMVPVI